MKTKDGIKFNINKPLYEHREGDVVTHTKPSIYRHEGEYLVLPGVFDLKISECYSTKAPATEEAIDYWGQKITQAKANIKILKKSRDAT